MPIQVPLSYMYLDEGKGIKEMLRSHVKHRGTNHLFIWHKCSNAKLTSAQKRRHTEVNLYSDEDTSTQSSPIKTRRASFEMAANFLTSDDIK